MFLLQGLLICLFSSCSNIEANKENHTFNVAFNVDQSIEEFDNVKFEPFDNLNLSFFRGNVWIKLNINNEENENKSYMFINNDRFNRNYVFYKLDTLTHSLKLVHQIQDTSKKDYRTFNNPNPNLKIDLAPNEIATYLITTNSDGRTKDATPKIMDLETYFDFINETTILNIIFYGIIFCLVLINIYQWSIYKQEIYIYYIFYITSTFLVYLGIEGYFFSLNIKHIIIDHFVFICVKMWALSLIVYTSKFLDIQTVAPRYYKLIKLILIVVLGGTLIYQFTFYNSSIQHLHYFENVLSSLWLVLIVGMILLSVKNRRLELKYYLIPLAGFILFTIIGLIDVHFQILPGNAFNYVKLGAIIELIGFTYFMTVLIKKKLKKAERLENELLENKKQLQTAAIELEKKDKILSTKKQIEKTDLISIFKLVENSLSTETEWDEFKLKFNKLKPEFHEKLLAFEPKLTKSEIRLLTLINIGYSQKEIAQILSIAPDSVKKARSRVRKKINLSKKVSLKDMLSQL